MHILVATGIFHPESGGPATYLYHLLPEMIARGHTVEVVTFGDDSTEGYPYAVQRISRQQNILTRNWQYFSAVKSRMVDADGVFINSLGIWLPRIHKPNILKIVGDRAWERALNRGWLPRTTDIDLFQTQTYSPLIEAIKWMRSREARKADHIIVPSHYLKRMVMGWGVREDKISVVYNALDAQDETTSDTNREDIGLPTGKLLLYVGRLTPWKGLDRVIDALKTIPDVSLAIIGDGETRTDLENQVQELNLHHQVKFLGKIPHDQLAEYYRSTDYVILYSGYEGLSHVILEALNAATPVIASDKCGNPEVIQHLDNGLLVPFDDTDALIESIRLAFENDLPQRLRKNIHLPDHFRWQTLVEQTIRLLETRFIS